MAVGIGGADVVLHAFGPARHGIVHVAIKDLVELQDVVPGNGNRIIVLMNEGQNIPVACNLLLVPVFSASFSSSTSCRIAGVGGNNALNGIGCLGTLHLCDLHQFLQFLRPLFQIQLLFPGLLIDCRN